MKELMEILEELRPDVNFDVERHLVTEGVFDSFDIVNLIDMLDEKFEINIKPSLITPDNFDSVEAMIGLINSLRKRSNNE